MVAAADLPESADTFLTSNAIPQKPTLNRGSWRRLENNVRARHATHVITGAIYANCGNEKIEAPCVVYKIAFLKDGQILAHFAENAEPRPSQGKDPAIAPAAGPL